MTGALPVEREEAGDGPAIVLVPGSFSTLAAWRPVAALLRDRFRVTAISLPGYGRSAERRDPAAPGIVPLAEAVAETIAGAGGPVHLVGHSFGGTVALAAALAGAPVARMTLVEANPVDVLRQARDTHYGTLAAFHDAYRAAVAAGEPDPAERVVDFWGGPGTHAALPEAVRGFIARSVATNLLDWACSFGMRDGPEAYARLVCPVRLLHGTRSHPVAAAMNRVLAAWLPDARIAVVDDASHFMISTHPGEVAGLIAAP